MNFIREYKTYLKGAAAIWMVSLILCLLGYMIVLRPQNNHKRRLNNVLAEQKQLYASARRAAQEKTKIELNVQLEQLSDHLKAFVIDLEELTDLTFDISQIANQENLASFSVTPRSQRSTGRQDVAGEEADTKHIHENLIDIRFTAGFRQFATFVNALERHHPVLFIDEFKINHSTQNESMYQATLDVAAFVRNQQKADTKLTSTVSAKL